MAGKKKLNAEELEKEIEKLTKMKYSSETKEQKFSVLSIRGYTYEKLSNIKNKEQNLRRAIIDFTEALEYTIERGGEISILGYRGICYFDLSQIVDKKENVLRAIDDFTKLITIKEKDELRFADFYYRGISYKELSKFDDKKLNLERAIEDFKLAEKLPNDNDERIFQIFLFKGLSYKELSKFDDKKLNLRKSLKYFGIAFETLKKIKGHPLYNPILSHEKGNVYSDMGDFHRAILYYKDALENIDKSSSEKEKTDVKEMLNAKIYLARGIAQIKFKEPEKAIEDFERGLEIAKNIEKSPEYGSIVSNICFNRGVAYYKLGDNERAKRDFEEAIKIT